MKTVDFSENFAASDLKIGRCRHLIEFRMYVSIEGQGHLCTIFISRFCMFCVLLGLDIR